MKEPGDMTMQDEKFAKEIENAMGLDRVSPPPAAKLDPPKVANSATQGQPTASQVLDALQDAINHEFAVISAAIGRLKDRL